MSWAGMTLRKGYSGAMRIDKERAEKAFHTFLEPYDQNDPKIVLKKDHTYNVAALCAQIAGDIGLSAEDRDLAWLCGLLHDLGRFAQTERYGTFSDDRSINHAALSADMLFKEGLIRDFVSDRTADQVIEKAVRLHNVYALPSGLSPTERQFCEVLRDADKIDILRVNCVYPVNVIYDVSEEEFRQAGIGAAVMDDVRHRRLVDLRHAETAMDGWTAHIAFVFGIVYDESLRLLRDLGYVSQLCQYPSENKDTCEKLQEVYACVKRYMADRGIEQR